MKKRYLIFPIFVLFILLYFKDFWCLRVKVTDDISVQQVPFCKNYIMKSRKKGKIVDHVYEWRVEDNYVYGSGDYYLYIYDTLKDEIFVYYDKEEDIFYEKLDKLGYHYTMDNCTRVIDFTMIN